ncbi:hypothetical protein L2E82_26664 [Cichorium intybus]|uniref:Uncharacterized protein n=1 Tax=Cichorium intybus TaxID=13427 RepID=A0ACB9CQU8_CICIN|nr:hypothetical protein L2E82_26664 [Cichorium intybus]
MEVTVFSEKRHIRVFRNHRIPIWFILKTKTGDRRRATPDIEHHNGSFSIILDWPGICDGKIMAPRKEQRLLSGPFTPNMDQLSWLNTEWSCILNHAQLHMNLLEPFMAFRRVMLQILSCKDCTVQHLLESACILRKGCRFSQSVAALHTFKYLYIGMGGEDSKLYWLGRMFEFIDVGKNGKIIFKEFLVGSAHILNQSLFQQACKVAFIKSDIDQDLYINEQEFGDSLMPAMGNFSIDEVSLC